MTVATAIVRDAEMARQLLSRGYPYPDDGTGQGLGIGVDATQAMPLVMGSAYETISSSVAGNLAWTGIASGGATAAAFTQVLAVAGCNAVYASGANMVVATTVANMTLFSYPPNTYALTRNVVPTRLAEVADRLILETGRLRDGWDGTGGYAPAQETIQTLSTMLSLVPPETSIPEAEVDATDGSVGLRWYASDASWVLSLTASGRQVTGVLSSRTESTQWAFDVDEPDSIESAIATALDQIANA